MCHAAFTEIIYLQFCGLKIIPATGTETKTQKKLLRTKYYHLSIKPVPGAARSKAEVCGRSPAEIVGSYPTEGMDICLL